MKPASLSVTVLSLIAAAQPTGATLVGDSVGAIASDAGVPDLYVSNPFTSPAVVGPGVEFTGQWSVFGDPYTVTLDFDANGLVLQMTGLPNTMLNFGTVSISDLDWLPTPKDLVGVTEAGTNPTGVEIANLTADSFDIVLGGNEFIDINSGTATYQLDFVTVPVPEPATAMLLGLGAMIAARRRR